jgi:hypothetical protein
VAPSRIRPGRCCTRRRDANTCQRGCCGSFGATAPPTLRPTLTTGAIGAPACCVHLLAMRRALRRDDGRPVGGALGLRTALPHRPTRRHDGVCRLRRRQCNDAQGSPWPPCPRCQGPQHLSRRRVIPRLHRRAATCHFARIRGVGFLWCTRPGDVPAVPRRHRLLVRLLRRLQHRELRPCAGVLRGDHQQPGERPRRGRSR